MKGTFHIWCSSVPSQCNAKKLPLWMVDPLDWNKTFLFSTIMLVSLQVMKISGSLLAEKGYCMIHIRPPKHQIRTKNNQWCNPCYVQVKQIAWINTKKQRCWKCSRYEKLDCVYAVVEHKVDIMTTTFKDLPKEGKKQTI